MFLAREILKCNVALVNWEGWGREKKGEREDGVKGAERQENKQRRGLGNAGGAILKKCGQERPF